MVSKILDAISRALSNEFGLEYEIYLESVKQGLQEPCFIVTCINEKQNLFFDKRYLRRHKFSITYLPKLDDISDFHNIGQRLFKCLEYIKDDKDLIRGENMSKETVDNMLIFFVDYDFFVRKMTDKDKMGSHLLKSKIKN